MNILDKDKYKGVNDRQDVQELRSRIKDSFVDLIFYEEPHTYYLNGVQMRSVSSVVESFAPVFDSETQSQRCFERYFNNPDSRYYQMTQQQILKEWDDINAEACEMGHNRHQFAEDVFNLLTENYESIQRPLVNGNLVADNFMEEYVIKYFNDLPLRYLPILSECKVYSKEYRYSGTFDLLLADDNGTDLSQRLLLQDWKTNKDLFKNFKEQKMNPPFDNLLDMPLSHYILQLSLYQIPLNDIGCRVIDRRLMWLNTENTGTYEIHRLSDMTEKLKQTLS